MCVRVCVCVSLFVLWSLYCYVCKRIHKTMGNRTYLLQSNAEITIIENKHESQIKEC